MSIKEQKISLFIVPGVPEDYPFKTKTRKEISVWYFLTNHEHTDVNEQTENRVVQADRLAHLETKQNRRGQVLSYITFYWVGFHLYEAIFLPHVLCRALKAFVNERKPRPAPRKAHRAKKPPSQTPYTAHNERISYDIDVTHESSSQSSSAENGEPQTPSPHYSESLVNPIPQVEGRDSTKPGTSDVALDPHFVRLLSSLTMSASKSKSSVSEEIQKHPNLPLSVDTSQHDNKDPSTPVPISASSTGSHHPTDWSTSAPKPFPSSSPQFRAAAFTPLSTEVPPSSHHSPLSLSQDIQPLSTHPFNGVSYPQSPSRHTSFTHIPSSPTNTVVSPRSTYRRTSSIADISPYLSRPTEVPASAKTLKQIALLEAVADESARMISSTHREPPSDLHHTRQSFRHSMTPGVVPPPSLMPISRTPLPPDSSYEPYHIRPRTSHAFHAIPPNPQGSAQNQLLSLMNSPRAASQVPHFYPPVQHPSFPRPGAVPASHYPIPMSTTAEASGLHALKNTPQYNSNSLLSILNNSRRRSGVLNSTPSMFNGAS
jgi:mRNA-decapping enzyme subunit 2